VEGYRDPKDCDKFLDNGGLGLARGSGWELGGGLAEWVYMGKVWVGFEGVKGLYPHLQSL